MKNAVTEWLKQAGEELDMAAHLLKGNYYRGACYHVQRSVEKALEAGLFKKGWELEKTHSAARLVAIGKDLRVKVPLTDEEIIFIDSIYRGRYPAEAGLLPFGTTTREDAEKSIKLAQKLLKNVLGRSRQGAAKMKKQDKGQRIEGVRVHPEEFRIIKRERLK